MKITALCVPLFIFLASCAKKGSGDLPVSVTLDFSVTPSAQTFGPVLVGSESSEIEFKFENKGNVPIGGCATASIPDGDKDDFEISKDDCGTEALGLHKSCSVYVKAKPTSMGAKGAIIVRRCIGGQKGIPMLSPLTAVGIYPVLAWTPASNDFGNVLTGSSTGWVDFVFSNTGTAPATGCTAPVINDLVNYTIKPGSDTCDVNDLPIGATCTVSLKANPTTAVSIPATLIRSCTVGGSQTANLSLTGIEPVLAWTPTSNDFGNIASTGTTAGFDFVFANTGTAKATGCSAPVLSGADAAKFTKTADTCDVNDLAVGDNCLVTVTAAPGAVGTFYS